VNTIQERLNEIARNIFDDNSLMLTDSTAAADVTGWDSLAHINFMFSIENEFGVQFSDDEFTGFEDIGELTSMLAEKLRT
jgi:acyl carrier protein